MIKRISRILGAGGFTGCSSRLSTKINSPRKLNLLQRQCFGVVILAGTLCMATFRHLPSCALRKSAMQNDLLPEMQVVQIIDTLQKKKIIIL